MPEVEKESFRRYFSVLDRALDTKVALTTVVTKNVVLADCIRRRSLI